MRCQSYGYVRIDDVMVNEPNMSKATHIIGYSIVWPQCRLQSALDPLKNDTLTQNFNCGQDWYLWTDPFATLVRTHYRSGERINEPAHTIVNGLCHYSIVVFILYFEESRKIIAEKTSGSCHDISPLQVTQPKKKNGSNNIHNGRTLSLHIFSCRSSSSAMISVYRTSLRLVCE